ncbi:hypothetical protein ABW48_06295 [Pluralibacter gergoviae]|nr:hypothetical protein SS31_23175 [Pluralibacter gergoviae]KOR02310.1 hypothetical protein ABW48_06295 [Pluralibacter gergoviae]VGO99391.1 hypothetical protein SB00610_00552 [Klebsiella quasipneumoniae subsp. similipneumoniae]
MYKVNVSLVFVDSYNAPLQHCCGFTIKSNFYVFVDLLIMVLCFFIFQNSLTSKAKKRHTQSDHFIITQLC